MQDTEDYSVVPLVVRQAQVSDIGVIEEVYRSRVMYNDHHDMHQWNLEDVTWIELSKLYSIEDVYVGCLQDEIVCACCIVDIDLLYWPTIKKAETLFLHKIVVHPKHAKCGFADVLIQFFIEKGRGMNYADVRLDVRLHKTKLRAMYERNGFKLVTTGRFHPAFETALYAYALT